jgi:hypothetical protein
MEPVTTDTRARHDLVVPKVVAPATRVVVRSFGVDGPAALVDRFVACGQRLQRAIPNRVPQSEAVMRHRLSSAFGWYRTGTARHFVATIDGQDIGRCSAMIDAGHVDADGVPVGMVGQWECDGGEAGTSASHALLELAIAWLREQGAAAIVGPIDFSTWYGYRFLEGPGDGRDPMLTEPVTAAHSREQRKAIGFEVDETYFSDEIQDIAHNMELGAELSRELISQGWKVRQLRMREWDQLIDQAYEMSMREFTRQPYFAPISREDFRANFDASKAGVDPRYVFTAWSPEGEFAGYVFGVRELGAAQRALQAGGLRGRLAAAREAWRTDHVMVKTICVARPYRQIGVTILLQYPLYCTAVDTGHTRVSNMLMHANNRSRALTEIAGGEEFRTYVTLRLAS